MVRIKTDYRIATPINANLVSIKRTLREDVNVYWIGYFRLTGDNPIVNNGHWPLIRHVASHEGMFAYVRQAGDVYRVASVNSIISNDAGEIEKVNVTYKDAWGATGGAMKKDELTDMKNVIVGLNTYEMVPDTHRINPDLEDYLDHIFKADVFDLEAARPRMFIRTNIFPESPERKKLEDNVRAFNIIVFSSLENSQVVELKDWDPQSKVDALNKKWDRAYGMYRQTVGMVYNTSKTPETERQPVAEIKMVKGQFSSPESIRLQPIETFLRKIYDLWGGKNYTLLVPGGEIAFQIGDDFSEEEKETPKAKSKKDKEEMDKENGKKKGVSEEKNREGKKEKSKEENRGERENKESETEPKKEEKNLKR
jgi:hypothetical protein